MTVRSLLALVDPALTTAWVYREDTGGYTVHHARRAGRRTRIELTGSRPLNPNAPAVQASPVAAYQRLATVARQLAVADPARLLLCRWRIGQPVAHLAQPAGPGRVELRQVEARADAHGLDLLEPGGTRPLWTGPGLAGALAWAIGEPVIPAQTVPVGT